jgi:ABC-type dipeptide/oligopeptide/nickel transport system permease subunit
LGQAAGEAATRGLASLVDDGDVDRAVKEHAVFALSQQPRAEGIPALIRIARTYPAGAISAAFVLTIVLMAICAPLLAPYNPTIQNMTHRLARPSFDHLLGTDDFVRDVLSRLIVGSRTTLLTAIFSVALACLAGMLTGTLAAYFGGRLDAVLMLGIDIMLSFPLVLLALLIVAVLGAGVLNLILAVGISQIPLFARLSRSLALTLRSREYVEAARSLGAGHVRILRLHVIPNMLGPIGVQVTTTMALAIVTTSSLSFLGFGIQPPTPDWGVMIFEARRFLLDRPDILFYPAAAIVATVVSLNAMADNLSTILDPTARGVVA